MRTFLSIIFVYLISIGIVKSQTTWVAFTNSEPSRPKINLQTSTNQLIRFRVEIPGMNQELLTYNGINYQRLTLLSGQNWGDPGYPEIPSIGKLIAIPESSGFDISVEVFDSLIFDGYNIYPAPEIIEDTSAGDSHLEQAFVKNDSVYGLDQFFPPALFLCEDGGYLRDQKILKKSVFPFKYNPSTQKLIVYNQFEITITFRNPVNEVNANIGLFGKITQQTLLNPGTDNVPPPSPLPSLEPGSVTWKILTDTSEAKNIVADYLIITDDQFFNPNHSFALQKLAYHRAIFNGFDVVIVSVQNILSLNFFYDPPPVGQDSWIPERKVRTFIKRVYEGKHATHTYDGRVAFLCLVGDAFIDGIDAGMLTSYDPYPTGNPQLPGQFWSANDFYFTCVTKNASNQWDLLGDLFVGRLCADNESDLNNIVAKIMHNENEYCFESWKKNNMIAYGGPFWGSDPIAAHQYFCVDLKNWLNSIYQPGYSTVLADSDISGSNWNQEYMNVLNNVGANIVMHLGHGQKNSWCRGGDCYNTGVGALTTQYKMEHLENTAKYPFVISTSCFTGAYSLGMPGVTDDCIGEKITLFSQNKGYVAYFGSWKAAGMTPTQPGEFPRSLQEKIIGAIYLNLSSVIGEAVLEARVGVSDPTYNSSYNALHFQHNLFGDPAYNVMVPGYEITQNTTLPPTPPYPHTITISNTVFVRSGVRLTISADAVMEFSENGQLIVENGATLEIGDNVQIKGLSSTNKIMIEGVICGPGGDINNPIPITNLKLTALDGRHWNGIEFNNPALTSKIESSSLSDCSITGELANLEITNTSSFSNAGIILSKSGLIVNGVTFTNSNIMLTNSNLLGLSAQILNSSFQNSEYDAMIRIEHYPSFLIQNCSISFDHGTGIDLFYCGNSNSQYLIKNNTIQKSGNSQDMSWGIKVYRTFANIENNLITNNRYGVTALNQSQVRLIGHANASSESETQRIFYNYQNQVRASDNSFPFYFHYNIIKNLPTGNTFLIYYDPGNPAISPKNSFFNIKCNCFDNSNPSSQLYPSGWFNWSVWCPPSSCQSGDPSRESFETAVMYMDSLNYETAEVLFKEIITTYPGSKYAIEAAKKLVPLEELSDQEFNDLFIYYDTASALHSDSLSEQLVYRLKNQCTIEQKNYVAAITWFENDIMNPLSVNDSVYSLIDLGDTYLQMQADSGLKSSNAGYTGFMARYKPKNHVEHIIRCDEWIKILFKDKHILNEGGQSDFFTNQVKLIQNIPNPFTSSTEIEYTLPERNNVSIIVNNIIGQQIMKFDLINQEKGAHTLLLDFSGVPNGVYFISLISEHIERCKIKAIKAK